MNFFNNKFEDLVRNCGYGIISFMNLVERTMIASSEKHPVGSLLKKLDDRISRIEGLHEIIVEEEVNKPTRVHSDVKLKKNVSSEDLQVRIGENYRSVLLKSPETVNDEAWVHVHNLQN